MASSASAEASNLQSINSFGLFLQFKTQKSGLVSSSAHGVLAVVVSFAFCSIVSWERDDDYHDHMTRISAD